MSQRNLLITALLLIILMTVCICAGLTLSKTQLKTPVKPAGLTTSSPTAPQPTTMPPTLPPPTPTPTEPPHLGDIVARNGYQLQALQVEDPTPGNLLYDPEPSHKLVAIKLMVGNEGAEEFTVNPFNCTLIDRDGYSYRPALGESERAQIEMVNLTPGLKVVGWVAFKIPETAIPAALKYEFSIFPSVSVTTGLNSF